MSVCEGIEGIDREGLVRGDSHVRRKLEGKLEGLSMLVGQGLGWIDMGGYEMVECVLVLLQKGLVRMDDGSVQLVVLEGGVVG